MRLLLLSRIGTLVLATSFVLNILAVLELRDVQREEQRLREVGQQALNEVSTIRSELLAMQKFVAVYVATSDSRWLIHYYDIADLHSGRKSFSRQPPPGYWDTILAGENVQIRATEQSGPPLQDRLIALDIAGDNRLLTVNLLEASRRLRERERIIFAVTQGLYDVKRQEFVSEAPPNPAYATGIIYSPAHLQLGNEVDGYLNSLFDDIKNNLESRGRLMQERTAQAGTLLLVLSLISGALLLLFIWLLRMGVMRPIEKMASVAGNVAEGDYSAAIPESRMVEEIGTLAQSMNRMIRAVRFDLMQKDLARKATEAMYRAEQAREKAELETRIKSRFLANMTHELRTPLNAVIGLSQLLFKTELTSRQANYVGKVVDAGKFLLGLVNDILDFSKAEAGKITLEEQPVNLVELISNASSLLSQSAEQKGIGLRTELAMPADLWVLTDGLRIRQILTNLLSNAVKFTSEGEVCVVATSIAAGSGERGRIGIRLEVRDSGIGMTPEQVSQAFEEFRQADQSTTRLYGGTGLGLTIVKRLVDALKGHIRIDSVPNMGTTFTLDFELTPCEAPQLASAPAAPAGQTGTAPAAIPATESETVIAASTDEYHATLESLPAVETNAATALPLNGKLLGLAILLVEDNPINQEVARDTLELEGAQVTVCDNGQEAVNYFGADNRRADLVLMDIEMPIMDGYAATEALRRRYTPAELPILGMTAHAFEEARDRCMMAGMNSVMTKPFDIDRLADWIRDNLQTLKAGQGVKPI